jgi:hypothetical protein
MRFAGMTRRTHRNRAGPGLQIGEPSASAVDPETAAHPGIQTMASEPLSYD